MVTFSEFENLGRLGNRLFQLAATIGYALKHKRYYEIPSWQYNKSFNGIFNINPLVKMISKDFQYKEPFFHYKEIPLENTIDLYGYYQSEKYFENCIDKIKEMFSFRTEISDRIFRYIIENAGTRIPVSIHVRRTDYVGEMAHYYHELDLEWYKKAMNHFDHNTHQFFILSDDIQWCKTHMTYFAKNIIFSNFDEIHDLCLMTECKHNIIANSSFSWWGSYLNKNPEKIVIAPAKDKWFKPVAGHNVDDLYLPNWRLL